MEEMEAASRIARIGVILIPYFFIAWFPCGISSNVPILFEVGVIQIVYGLQLVLTS